MNTSGGMKTSAFHHSAQGKADRMSAFSVKPPGDRTSPMSTSGEMKTLAFHHATQGKADRMSAFSVKSAVSSRTTELR